jgi:AMP-binding enzyme
VLLYITAEEVLHQDMPERRGPRPLHTIPTTVSALYDMGMRHHVRPAVMSLPAGDAFEEVPDWKLDRLVIRTALYGRERLGLEAGVRAAVFGRLSWLWPVVDFAVTGLGAISVGIEHDVSDETLETVLREAEPRVVFATDSRSVERLDDVRGAGRLPRAVIVAEGRDGEGEGRIGLAKLLDHAGVLDTPERAQAFRTVCRAAAPEAEALWHAGGTAVVRLTQSQAMARIADRLRAEPAEPGDVAYIEAPRADLAARLALHAFAGDGLTATFLGRAGRTADDVAQVRPHKMHVAATWLEAACAAHGPRWPGGLDRRRARRRLRGGLGGRLRWVRTERPPTTTSVLALAGVGVHVVPNDSSTRGLDR